MVRIINLIKSQSSSWIIPHFWLFFIWAFTISLSDQSLFIFLSLEQFLVASLLCLLLHIGKPISILVFFDWNFYKDVLKRGFWLKMQMVAVSVSYEVCFSWYVSFCMKGCAMDLLERFDLFQFVWVVCFELQRLFSSMFK